MARHRLWGYVVVPLLLNVGLVVGTTALALHVVRDRIGATAAASPLAQVGVWAVALLLGLAMFVVLQPVVGAPFIDLLTDKAERLARGTSPGTGIISAAWQAMVHGLLKSVFYALGLLLALALSALTGIGGLAGLALAALFLAFDGFDYPLARRGVSFGGKWRYLVLHPGQTLGYCLGASLLYLVPLAVVVAPAFAAVGATLAYLDSAPAPAAASERKAIPS